MHLELWEATVGRWGVTLPLTGVPIPDHRALVAELTALGYTDVWSAETSGSDAFTPLALAAQWSPEVRLGTAIAPVYTRGPALLAMSAATLAEVSGGRFVLGIGSSSPAIVTRWNGAEFAEPYARTRDTLRFLRAALAGEKVTREYPTFSVSGFRLEKAPEHHVPIVLAALRPGMLRLAAREADGAITNWLAAEDVPRVREALGPDKELAARIFVCPTEDADAARALGRALICAYLTVPAYAAFHDWLGRGEALTPMREAWAAGRRTEANALVPDEVVDALVVHGSPERCRSEIAQYAANGVDTPIIGLLPTGEDQLDLARRLAPGVG
ncbi:Luciferase-like monooxygenase [Actinosynnema mirum DSM 43827]|uniref:Luciferase-like monooxygenase n=1 Tax=Actinosynnema mirum (strain ATCC 29888 / DSM 43827 / JCM 3225 / NBRC 14064 / NCIMB 13271 / NRRL B-12336 / IMRU 3971 / 101) TaxID=446462 RepID=C6W894_ACTMD|nr:Luciferase-like monooxygenase [Actinosynnema mirum DSM 43827]